MAKKPQSNTTKSIAPRSRAWLLGFVLLITIASAAYYWLSQEYPELFKLPTSITSQPRTDTQEEKKQTVTTDPLTGEKVIQKTPTPLIPDKGTAGTFAVSSGNKTDPQMTNVEIDPLDASKGDNLKIQVTMNSIAEVQNVKGWVKSDTTIQEIVFSRISRVGITEIWSGSIILNSTVDHTYILTLEASDGKNTRTLPLGIRKP